MGETRFWRRRFWRRQFWRRRFWRRWLVLEEVDLEEAVGKADSRIYQKRGRKSSFFKRSVHGEVLNISNNVLINRHHMQEDVFTRNFFEEEHV